MNPKYARLLYSLHKNKVLFSWVLSVCPVIKIKSDCPIFVSSPSYLKIIINTILNKGELTFTLWINPSNTQAQTFPEQYKPKLFTLTRTIYINLPFTFKSYSNQSDIRLTWRNWIPVIANCQNKNTYTHPLVWDQVENLGNINLSKWPATIHGHQ